MTLIQFEWLQFGEDSVLLLIFYVFDALVKHEGYYPILMYSGFEGVICFYRVECNLCHEFTQD